MVHPRRVRGLEMRRHSSPTPGSPLVAAWSSARILVDPPRVLRRVPRPPRRRWPDALVAMLDIAVHRGPRHLPSSVGLAAASRRLRVRLSLLRRLAAAASASVGVAMAGRHRRLRLPVLPLSPSRSGLRLERVRVQKAPTPSARVRGASFFAAGGGKSAPADPASSVLAPALRLRLALRPRLLALLPPAPPSCLSTSRVRPASSSPSRVERLFLPGAARAFSSREMSHPPPPAACSAAALALVRGCAAGRASASGCARTRRGLRG